MGLRLTEVWTSNACNANTVLISGSDTVKT